MKIRVVPFDENAECYVIQYKHDGWLRQWKTLTRAFLMEDASLCTQYHPVLYENFDEARDFAQSLDKAAVFAWLDFEHIKYVRHMQHLEQQIAERFKTFTT